MSAPQAGGIKTSGKTVARKALIINEYKRRLRDNIRSLNDNFNNIINSTKIPADDAAHRNPSGRMAEFYVVKNEMAVRAALIARACDELIKLTSDLKEFLILHDFNFLTQSIEAAEKHCDEQLKIQMSKHNAMRSDITNLMADLDREYADNYLFRH